MMPFLVISRRGFFSPLKLKEFLSSPGWRWFVLHRWLVLYRCGYRCAEACVQLYTFWQAAGRKDEQEVYGLRDM